MKKTNSLKAACIAIIAGFMLIPGISFSQTKPSIIIDGQAALVTQTAQFPFWLSAGQTLAVGNKVISISVLQYIIATNPGGGNDLQFDSTKKITTIKTVPANRTWKIESVAIDTSANLVVSGSGGGDNLGNHTATTNLDMSNKRITGLANPTTLSDAVNAAIIENNTLNYVADGGAVNAYTVTLSPAPAAYTTGMIISFKAANTNTAASTLNVNNLGAKTIKKLVSADLDPNDIKSGLIVTVIYDGTNFQMTSQLGQAQGLSTVVSTSCSPNPSAYCVNNSGTYCSSGSFGTISGKYFVVGYLVFYSGYITINDVYGSCNCTNWYNYIDIDLPVSASAIFSYDFSYGDCGGSSTPMYSTYPKVTLQSATKGRIIGTKNPANSIGQGSSGTGLVAWNSCASGYSVILNFNIIYAK